MYEDKTNEELAAMIKQESRRELLPVLWERVKKVLFAKSAYTYEQRQKAFVRCGIEPKDLEQECYFVFLAAVGGFDPCREELFCTYLNFPFLRKVNSLLGTVNGRENTKPLDNAVSLNTPATDADGDTGAELLDLVSDPDTVPHDVQLTRSEQKRLIRAAVLRLDEPYKEIIQRSYYKNEPLSIIAKSLDMNFGQCSRARNTALLILRNTAEVKALAMFEALDELDGEFKTNPAFFLPYWNIFTASEKYTQAALKARRAQSYGQRQAVIYEAYQKYKAAEEGTKHG